MGEIDPDTLLEWLTMGQGDERDMQLIALEQLCMLLLMSDNVDRCFESCPPRTFLPALCHIFMDETAPDNILEVTARAITYYLDVSAECSRRIVSVEGAVKALCTRLVVVDISSRTSKDLAEQCVKVLELMCTREAGAIYDSGGLTCILSFIREYGFQIHKDTLHSAMSVVARLCAKMEPSDQNLEHCVDSLSVLLQAEDIYVADGALRCFACLADRFTRRGIDPAPLAKHGLSNVLLEKLAISAVQYSSEKASTVPATSPDTRSNSGNVSIVVSVLSTLCRGSPSVTHDLLRSNFLDAIEKAMQGDERCVLDTMRLIDLLVVLLFEGRSALPKSNSLSARSGLPGLKRMDSSAERSHRHLIDCIRSKDTDALVEAVDSGAFEVNYMDDVGQTLLNWASAFGTLEMVEFLCDRGADVNRGQRSSSLHYAACFGRPAVAIVLLKYGANPDLRDEDGKTPLDKARERNDEGHKELVRILQIPGEWMVPASGARGNGANSDQAKSEENKAEEATKNEAAEPAVKGDPEMAPLYVKRLLPVFAQTFRSSLVPSIRKATLAIMKKVIHLIPAEMMPDVIASCNIASNIVEVISSVLNVEDDDDGHLTAFQCVEDLMNKAKDTFLVHFVRLGVLNRIKDISESYDKDDLDIGEESEHSSSRQAEIMPLEDEHTISQGKPYHWHDWCIARSRDCLYLWSDFCAIELSNGSNGWFRFVLDGKLATMYSSGSPEGGSGSAESRSEFLEKLQRARSQVPSGTSSQPLLSSQSSRLIVVGNWSLTCKQPGHMTIYNADGQQETTLKEDLPGFIFESNRGTKHTFTAETSLGPDFAATWSGKPGRRYQSKKEQVRRKIGLLAHDINRKYFEEALSGNYGAMGKLREISTMLDDACSGVSFPSEDSEKHIYTALKELCDLLKEESILSSYEIQSSGLVTSLLNCLNKSQRPSVTSMTEKPAKGTSEIFKSVFGDMPQNVNGDESMLHVSLAVALVKKLIAVLESIEKLPVVVYEHSGGGSGLQVLLRRLRVRLERDSKSTNLIDQSGKYLKMEPLTSVKDLKKHLLRVVAKQWYDYDRNTFQFIQHFKENKGAVAFDYDHDFDSNGIIYWAGTNARTVADWVNPAQYGIMVVVSSDGRSLPYGKPEDVLNRDPAALNCHTSDDTNSWFIIDAGLWITPTAYTLRHARGYGRSALRNWTFQGSKEGQTWNTLFTHINDTSLNEPGSTATWMIDAPSSSEGEQAWRMFRVQQNGPNASGQTHYLSLSGFEIYGTVSGITDDPPGSLLAESDSNSRKQRRIFRSQVLRQMALGGKEGADLRLLKERARQLGEAVDAVKSDAKNEGWVDVSWIQSTNSGVQKRNAQDHANVQVVDISDPDVQTAISKAEIKDSFNSKSTEAASFKDVAYMPLKEDHSSGNKRTLQSDSTDDAQNGIKMTREANSGREVSAADLANLRLLIAVEDLLDNASSDLVASALAEARNLDQLRATSRSIQSEFLTGVRNRHTTPSQGSRESTSPTTVLHAIDMHSLDTDSANKGLETPTPASSRESPLSLVAISEEAINSDRKARDDANNASNSANSKANADSNTYASVCANPRNTDVDDSTDAAKIENAADVFADAGDAFADAVAQIASDINATESITSAFNGSAGNQNARANRNANSQLLDMDDESANWLLNPNSNWMPNFDAEGNADDGSRRWLFNSLLGDSEDLQEAANRARLDMLAKELTAGDTEDDGQALNSADAKLDSADARSESADAESESADARPDSADARSDSADVGPDSADAGLGSADARSDSADAGPDSADANSDSADTRPDPADARSDAADTRPDSAAMKLEEDKSELDRQITDKLTCKDTDSTTDVETQNKPSLENPSEPKTPSKPETEAESSKTPGSEVSKIKASGQPRMLPVDDYDDQYETTFFDARTDEVSESDKNRQNNRARDAPIDEGDLMFGKNSQVELTVSRPDQSKRPDSLEKTPEGLTLLEAIEAKLDYDSDDEYNDPCDEDEEKDEDDAIIDKRSFRIYSESTKPVKMAKKKIDRELVLTSASEDKETPAKDVPKSSSGETIEKYPEIEAKDGSKSASNLRQRCSLMVDMEEDYMEDYPMDVDEGDDTDEFEDIENEDENDPDDLYERTMSINHPTAAADRPAEMRRRLWDDDFVLKRQFSALIPAFDPRPGRTNVSQHQDVVIPEEGEVIQQEEFKGDELKLCIRGKTANGKDFEIELDDPNASVFSYIQKLTTSSMNSGGKLDKQRRVWEPAYTIVYTSRDACVDSTPQPLVKWDVSFVDKYLGTNKLPKTDVVKYLQQNADTEFIRKWRLTGSAKSCRKQRNCNQLRNAYKAFSVMKKREAEQADEKVSVGESAIDDDNKGDYSDVFAPVPTEIAPAKEILHLIKSLHKLCEENMQFTSLTDDYLFDVPEEEFISMKLTNKLMQQIQEPLVLASGALPAWCEFLVINYPLLFPFETRKMYFQATAFGCSRSIVWLQSLHDANLERSRGHSARRLEPQEIRIGRLKHERVKVPRDQKELLQYAVRLLDFHAGRKAILEIEFKDEEGTGLGPSLEFYALVAKELQTKEIGMWVASDNLYQTENESGVVEHADTYVHHPNGLFPAPYPQDYKNIDRICKLFHFLGIFLAKCLQDNRLVDIPLSEPFHKLLCLGKLPPNRTLLRSASTRSENLDYESVSPRSSDSADFGSDCCCCYSDLFSDCDFDMIYPDVSKFTKQLKKLVKNRKEIISDLNISEQERKDKLDGLLFEVENGHDCKLEDLGLTFQYVPPSKSYGFEAVNLKPNGDHEVLTSSNAEEYIDLVMYFSMYKGIEKQLDAFRAGFSRVFPMEKLHAFSPREIQLMLSGEQAPKWTRDDLISYTEPKFGYTKESPGFQRLINVLVSMNGDERKAFLQFATGCSSLPPGGIANLHPRLTVVKKESEGDGSYPSVNTCVHYLKLPEYSSEEILRSKLLAATKEKGFHLN